MASAARKQTTPQALAGVDTQEALEAFRDPRWRLGTLYSIRTRDGSVIKFTPRPQQARIIDLIYRQGVRADHHPEGEAAWLLDALGRHLRGPALLRVGAADFADRSDHRGRPPEAARYRNGGLRLARPRA